jgi:Dynamin family
VNKVQVKKIMLVCCVGGFFVSFLFSFFLLGKSSVLESIVGEDFLPKSNELATRVPIRLRLVREKYSNDKFVTYAVIKGID